MILKCINSQRLCHFIEPYHAPYVPKHRYWTGLLLFIRISLYLVFALNLSGNPRVNLVAIIITVVCLLLIKGQFGRVYKSAFVDVIEMVCYANLCLFCTIRLAFGDDKFFEITALLSGFITLLLLITVISYHVYTTFCSKWLKRYQHRAEGQLDDNELPDDSATSITDIESSQCKPTFSVVELNLPGHGSQHSDSNGSSQMLKVAHETDDDNASLISADSTSPLLDTHTQCHA